MKKEAKEKILLAIGIFLVVLGVTRVLHLFFFEVPQHIFWLCNNVILLIGAAILFRSSFWLIAGFSLLFVGQIVWIISLVSYWVFGFIIPGTSAYVIYDSLFAYVIALAVHFLTLPLGFWAILLLNKKEKFAWIGSLIYALALLPFVISFGPEYNLNCLFKPCLDFLPNPFPKAWPIFAIFLYFALFVIPLNYLIDFIVRLKNIKAKKAGKA